MLSSVWLLLYLSPSNYFRCQHRRQEVLLKQQEGHGVDYIIPLLPIIPREISTLGHPEVTRISVIRIIEDFWYKIVAFIPKYVLASCESELRTVTSLIVLATIKRLADSDRNNKGSMDDIFRAADENGDG